MFPSLEIIAPKQVVKPGSEKRFARDRAFSWNPTAEEMPPILDFRPGTTIMGGRDSGFYDSEGIIIEAEHTGGDPKREEDWLFRVIAKTTDGEWLGPYWILLCDVGFPITEPEWLWEFPLEPSKPIDELLAAGEQELFEYFASHPKELVNLSPRRFEELVLAIYRNLGFATERVGAWNQQDGGVDLLAVSRTEAGTEFRIAIQCKTSGRKISARPIRELAGVLGVFHAHQGVVATTSAFTGPARKEVEGSLWQISLQDKDDLYRRILSILVPDLKL
ncbi:restriction endonuclease [bacterium]|nr:restriction endonuclease [bacterium]